VDFEQLIAKCSEQIEKCKMKEKTAQVYFEFCTLNFSLFIVCSKLR